MTVIETLEKIRCLDALIDSKLEQERHLREMAISISAPVSDGMPKSSSHVPDKIGIIVAKIVDLQQEINADIDRYVDTKAALVEAVKKLPLEERTVIECMYFHHERPTAIAKKLHCSRRTIYNIKDKAVAALEELMKK